MRKKVYRYLKSLRPTRQVVTAASLSILREEYRRLLESERFQNPLRLNRYGYSLYSQSDEDGIIDEIFRRISTTNRVFVEIGCGNGLENNSHALLLNGWEGLWIDASEESIAALRTRFSDVLKSGQLKVENAFVTRDNINDLIRTHYEGEIDLLSVDIDGNDFDVLHAIDCIDPRVVVAEYNARKGPVIDWVMQYNAEHAWDGSDYFGASLKAYEILMTHRGYVLVGCSISGVNAFFIKEELSGAGRFLAPFTTQEHFEPQRRLLRMGIHSSHPKNHGPWCTAEGMLYGKHEAVRKGS